MSKTKLHRKAKNFSLTFLETGGILLFPFNKTRCVVTLINIFIWVCLYFTVSAPGAYAYVIISIIANFTFLFLCFNKKGFYKILLKLYSPEKAFQKYKTMQAVTFFHYGFSWIILAVNTRSSAMFNSIPYIWFLVIGSIMFLVGFFVRYYATKTVSMNGYYCRDFFIVPSKKKYEKKGPYRYLDNPMYGVGYLMAYGIAILYASLPFLILIAISQCLIYTFYYRIEKPHIKKIYG